MTDAEQDLIAECIKVEVEACAAPPMQCVDPAVLRDWIKCIRRKVLDVQLERQRRYEAEVIAAARALAEVWRRGGLTSSGAHENLLRAIQKLDER